MPLPTQEEIYLEIENDMHNLGVTTLMSDANDFSLEPLSRAAASQWEQQDEEWINEFQLAWGRQIDYLAKIRMSGLVNMASKLVVTLLKQKFPSLEYRTKKPGELYYALWGFLRAFTDRVDLMPGGPMYTLAHARFTRGAAAQADEDEAEGEDEAEREDEDLEDDDSDPVPPPRQTIARRGTRARNAPERYYPA
jgi:hypothetical protein